MHLIGAMVSLHTAASHLPRVFQQVIIILFTLLLRILMGVVGTKSRRLSIWCRKRSDLTKLVRFSLSPSVFISLLFLPGSPVFSIDRICHGQLAGARTRVWIVQ